MLVHTDVYYFPNRNQFVRTNPVNEFHIRFDFLIEKYNLDWISMFDNTHFVLLQPMLMKHFHLLLLI